MLNNLKGKVAIVTGGAGTLGRAMAIGLAECGVKVGILSRTQSKVASTVKEFQEKGLSAIELVADVLDQSELEKSREKVIAEWGRIDILVNSAGGNMAGATILPEETIHDLSLSDFDKVTSLNLKGTLLPTLVFSKSMIAAEGGSIINISSMAAQRPMTRVLGYAVSKAGIDNLTKWLAVEVANKFGPNIRVNAIAPGFFVGEQNRNLLLENDGSLTDRGKTIIDHTPMGRFGDPEDLVGVTNWLAGDESKFVTGTIVNVDGGFSAFSGV